MRNPFDIMVILNVHLQVMGLKGIAFLLKRIFYTNRLIKIKLKGFSSPIYLRNNTSDITVFYQIFFKNSYKFNYGLKPETIIDCGANIGLSSVFYRANFPKALIIAIEPEKTNFELLQRNTEKFENIICIKGGIWNKDSHLLIEDEHSGNWDFKVKEVDYTDETTIPAFSIPFLMKEYQLKNIEILKIDIEGSEKELFESDFQHWLPKTKVLIIELHDGYRRGASRSFFKAISQYNFSMIRKEENLVFFNQDI